MKTITYYLEMTNKNQLCPKYSQDKSFRVLKASVKQWEFNKFLYSFIGREWNWRDKLIWSDAEWERYVNSEELLTYAAYYEGALAGYFELLMLNEEIEIAYFGLTPHFIGMKLGGPLLTNALESAWDLSPKRVWAHTCTLDHPAALQNYKARGMKIYKSQET
jgi:ribosomal protein S18 acetylase RimI-like enzyme